MKNLALSLLLIVVSCQNVDDGGKNQTMNQVEQTLPQIELSKSRIDSLSSMLAYNTNDSSYVHKYYDSNYTNKQNVFFRISQKGDLAVYSSNSKDLEKITCRKGKLEMELTPVLSSPVERKGNAVFTLLELSENTEQNIHAFYLAVKDYQNEELFVKFDKSDSFMERIWTTEEKDAFVGTYLYAYYLKTTNK